MSISQESVHSALKEVIDPNTGKDLLSTKSARNIKIDGSNVSLDVELAYPVTVEVPAGGPDQYRTVVLPLDRDEDAWVTAVDFEPGARAVVHHRSIRRSTARPSARDGTGGAPVHLVPGRGRDPGHPSGVASRRWSPCRVMTPGTRP